MKQKIILLYNLLVRLTSDKLRLLSDCLKAKSTAYRSSQRLLQLAGYLRVCKGDQRAREAAVLNLVAETALKVTNFAWTKPERALTFCVS